MRLIDADALMENLSVRYMTEIFPDWFEMPLEVREKIGLLGSTFKQAILNAPIIDAEPVRHGRWVVDDLGHTYCSKCGERLPFLHCYADEPNSDFDEEWDEEIKETRYCPNCGTKMGGGDHNGSNS